MSKSKLVICPVAKWCMAEKCAIRNPHSVMAGCHTVKICNDAIIKFRCIPAKE